MLIRLDNKTSKEINSEVGNKAKNLFLLKKNNFNVPNGIILDSDTYLEIIKDNKIDNKIDERINNLDNSNIKETSIYLQILFNDIKINQSIKQSIEDNIDLNKKYAVRSSGTKEDLKDYSFAGQYDTFLNVRGIDSIEKAIINCYKSMFSETILKYFIDNKISFNNLKMSIIIQEMVDADCSGVCFTVDPTTGRDKNMLIEVAKGLGDNIVSGKVIPEQYYYNWYDEEEDYKENNYLINKEELRKYSNEFLKIQILFGYPCDIEFAIKDKQVYILQARKITRIKYLGISDMWTTADFKDGGVSATICVPYMWSLYEYIWEYTLKKFLLESKILQESDVNKKLGNMFYARCYWNMSVVKNALSQVIGYKEREFDSEYGIKINYEGDGLVTKANIKTIIHIIKMILAQRKILSIRNKNAENYKKDLLNKYYEYKNMYDRKNIDNIIKTWYQLTKFVYLQSESTYFWQIFINTIHQSLYKGKLLKYVSESEYLSLLGGIDNISHLLPFYDIWNLSREIRNNDNIYKYWTENDSDILIKNIDSLENYMDKVKLIINKFGYHSDKELDVTYPCYYEDSISIINTVKDMVKLDDSFSPIEDKIKSKYIYEKLIDKISKQVSKKKLKKIKQVIENMRRMLWWREEYRDISTRFYYIIRVYTIELAKELKNKNLINDLYDIWFLKVTNIWDYIDGKVSKDEIRIIIKKNKMYYNSFKNYMSENEIGSVFSNTNNYEMKIEENKNIIKGIGANNGIVTGRARVIENFSQIDRIEKNDILVTKFTDTGWTAKFAILSGIVTEYGGILCHAAIVSREYGIPAIVSCHNAMDYIKDGEIITIDGSTGIIKKEDF